MKSQFVSENISFQRGSDPLRSMDLGGFSFETLRKGAILRTKKYFGVSISTGKIGGYHSSAISIGKGDWLLVTEVRDEIGGKKNISWRRYHHSHKEMAYDHRETLKEKGKLSFSFGPTSGFFDDITKRRFDYRLEIIEPGFSSGETNESIRFHRTGDVKRGLRIGERSWKNLRPGDILIAKQDFKVDRYGTPMPPSRGGGMFFHEGSHLVVVKATMASVFSSANPEARTVNGWEIRCFEPLDLESALEARREIESGTFDATVLRRPIRASIPALEKRLEIYEG